MEMITNFFKKQGIAFYALCVALVLSIVAVCMYSADVAINYFLEPSANPAVLAFGILAILLIVAMLVVSQLEIATNRYAKIALDVAAVVIVAFVVAALLIFLSDRVYHFAVVLGSDLEKGNPTAFEAVYHSVATIVLFGVTAAATLVASFFEVKKA